jgi:hypothetical protein
MDTWMGRSYDPETLNKYLYTHADPLNGTDPSGNATIFSLNSSQVMSNILAASIVGAGSWGIYKTGEILDEHKGFRTFSAWDVLAANQFKARTEVSTQNDAKAKEEEKKKLDNRPEGHHVIPTYLCGAGSQQLSSIKHKYHVIIHAEIAAMKFALKGAEEYASRKVGRTRTDSSLKLAQTVQGRTAIANALSQMYQMGGWWNIGVPTIGQAFTTEKGPYISGAKTSLPTCGRYTSEQ